MDVSLLRAAYLPEPVRQDPHESPRNIPANGPYPGILKRRETPFAALSGAQESLDEVPFRRGRRFPSHDFLSRPSRRAQTRPSRFLRQSDIRTQEPDTRDLTDKPGPLDHLSNSG